MTNVDGMPSYFWLASSRLKEPVQDHVPYTTKALRQDLLRVRNAWEESQASRKRDAIYRYLTAVFDLVSWWTAEGRALERAYKALRLQSICPFDGEEPFAAITLHRRSHKSRQTHSIQMVTHAAVCAGIQIEF
jgi:hypothetical protein